MLQIACPHCGVRDEPEFTFGGPAHVKRPAFNCTDAEWASYLFGRDNPKGVSFERWCHSFGCNRWFNVARDTCTHEIRVIYAIGASSPQPSSTAVSS